MWMMRNRPNGVELPDNPAPLRGGPILPSHSSLAFFSQRLLTLRNTPCLGVPAGTAFALGFSAVPTLRYRPRRVRARGCLDRGQTLPHGGPMAFGDLLPRHHAETGAARPATGEQLRVLQLGPRTKPCPDSPGIGQ